MNDKIRDKKEAAWIIRITHPTKLKDCKEYERVEI